MRASWEVLWEGNEMRPEAGGGRLQPWPPATSLHPLFSPSSCWQTTLVLGN